MASDAATNGGSSAAVNNLTPAQKLQEKHKAGEVHNATIEDVVDEEDIVHPPPSLHTAPGAVSTPVLLPAEVPVSDTAAGKQKVREVPNGVAPSSKQETPPMLDTQSEELFPALGGGPKSQAPAPLAKAWGAKKPVAIGQTRSNGSNGTNGNESLSNSASSRASTPASSVWTPTSANTGAPPQSRAFFNGRLSMPGKFNDRIQFTPSELLPRNQLKNPIPDVLRSINKRSKANVEMKPGPNGALVFEATGPSDDAVREALMETANQIGSKQSIKIPIPVSVRPHIIGQGGAMVIGISKRTGARIQVPKAEPVSFPNLEDDDSMTVDVVIEGNIVAVELARHNIEAILKERTTTVNLLLHDIPAEFFPFIAGPNNAGISKLENGRQLKVEIPHYYTWSLQPPPQAPSPGMVPRFTPHPKSHIRISGDRVAALEVRSEIQRQVEHLRHQITLSQLAINRGQHQFILGDNGELLHDLLQETGCAVILPPASDDTEFLSVTGPHDKIELGIEKVMNLATIMQMSSVDVARQHANPSAGAQVHARALTRYLQQRQAIEQLERQYDARIVLPTSLEGPMNWEVYSRDGKNTIRARSDIVNLVNAYPPARIRHVKADSFFRQHLQQHGAPVIRDNFGVHLVLPDKADQTPQVILVCEGPELQHADEFHLPKQKPSTKEIVEFEQMLNKAQAHILSLINDQDELGAATVGVPLIFHEKVQKFVDLQQQDLPPATIPVQITFGPVDRLQNSTGSSHAPKSSLADEHEVTLRGPSSAVEELAEKLVAFVEEQKQKELERGHITSFDFPQKYANFLIGKKGENINKYREEFDVDIQVKDGKVEIKGPKANAELAKSKIITLGKKLEDEATYVLKIKPQYHRELIGAKGGQVTRLQDRYEVRIQFPRTAQATSKDRSVADGASDVGGSRNNRTNQAPDEVIVRGPKKGADATREELLSLLQYMEDNSHSSTVSVAQSQLPSLIGQGGREMEALRDLTKAHIDVGNRNAADPSGRAQIQIKGTKQQVENAKKELEQKIKSFDETITKSIDVEKKYHSALIGAGGSKIRSIILEAGCPDVGRDLARAVRFPPQDSPETTIRVEGKAPVVDKIIAAIQSVIDQRHDQTDDTIEVAPGKHRLLIGPGGETRRSLESRFKVSIDIPKPSQQGAARSRVKIAGQPKDVEQAKAHIFNLVKNEDGETVQVPRKFHHTISENGQFFRRLRHDHNVKVDHEGQQPPPRPTPATRSRGTNGVEALPLITDDQDTAEKHSWEIVDFDGGKTDEGDIPWTLRGSSESVAKARVILEKAIEQAQAQQQSSTGYLVLPDPRKYRYIIGQGGSQINSIREQTGCKITVPRDQTKGEPIEIVGSRAGVEHAKEIILDIVQKGGNGGNGGRRA